MNPFVHSVEQNSFCKEWSVSGIVYELTYKSTLPAVGKHLGVKTAYAVLPIGYASRLVAQSFHHTACLVLYSFRLFTLFYAGVSNLAFSHSFPKGRISCENVFRKFLSDKNHFPVPKNFHRSFANWIEIYFQLSLNNFIASDCSVLKFYLPVS